MARARLIKRGSRAKLSGASLESALARSRVQHSWEEARRTRSRGGRCRLARRSRSIRAIAGDDGDSAVSRVSSTLPRGYSRYR